ncbi:MAG: HD-GYP domain-containing protein [Defluviitaleaceae bacterium]|nr:HD-GYP domain-containing protein [Defluviitaleaceae bacterium]
MRFVNIKNCKENMVLATDIFSYKNVILLRSGTILTQVYINKLKTLGYKGLFIEDRIMEEIASDNLISNSVKNEALYTITDIMESRFFSEKINVVGIKKIANIIEDIVDQIVRKRNNLYNMISIKNFDQYTYQHSVDVTILSILIGKELNLKRSELSNLGKAAIFHDIGKLFISPNILNKTSYLTKNEFNEIKKHCIMGHDFLKDSFGENKYICEAALYHHERYDGLGYPSGLKGEEIPLFARIISVADTYDAMTSTRPYREALPSSEAYEYIMGNKDIHFHADIVDAFLRKVNPYVTGSSIKLSNGEIGVIHSNNKDFMLRPKVKIEKSENVFDIVCLATNKNYSSVTIVESDV